MQSWVLSFQELDHTHSALVGSKGAHLGELSKIAGICVPVGFCVSTAAFQSIIAETPSTQALLKQLSALKREDHEQISTLCEQIRRHIEDTPIPADIQQAITHAITQMGEHHAYAVRSSATAEDLPTASFAGQYDTYLNILGTAAILTQIRKCWASLFTDRATLYRLHNGFDHRQVHLAVVVQKMVVAQVAGILFTADPVTSNRKILSIDASFGLGEALVSGLVNPDSYQVRDGMVFNKQIAPKKRAIYARKEGGTQEQAIEPEQQSQQALGDQQILQLAHMGRKIEAHFGSPQDIEWCWAEDQLYIVQSRPITTLYPIPEAPDAEKHVYVSVAHQQMMTDPMKPLGMSLFQLISRGNMVPAGGRLFVDCTPQLASPTRRKILLDIMGKGDPLMQDALKTITESDFIPFIPEQPEAPRSTLETFAQIDPLTELENNTTLVTDLIQQSQASITALKTKIQTQSGPHLMDAILEDIQELKRLAFEPQTLAVIMGAMNAATWLNEHMHTWLGEKKVADTLSLSVNHNITSQMGLALLDVADVIRPFPKVITYLQQVKTDSFLDDLVQLEGGQEAFDAIVAYLNTYGMRGPGEVDMTQIRFSEKPTTLLPLILSHIANFEPHAHHHTFEQGCLKALAKAEDLFTRLKSLPEGEQKVQATQHMITRLRKFTGYREYPKYDIVSRSFIYKQALLKEADKLVKANIIPNREDIYYLTFAELREVLRTQYVDPQLISQRKADYQGYEKLNPPRVITSEGEISNGKVSGSKAPEGALIGIPVSSGIIEGRARVVLKLEDARIETGDILITTFTDPGWTPLFVAIKGLVTEVGGLMTHGAVIAREYGLPAVVSVENATRLIKDGQRIRVNGTEGYIEIL